MPKMVCPLFDASPLPIGKKLMSPNSRMIFFWLFFVSIALIRASASRAEELRTWRDSTGRFTLRAKLESVENGKVFLIRENGQRITIPIIKFSQADREYLAKQQDGPLKATGPKTEKTAEQAHQIKVDWTSAKQVQLQTPDKVWNVTIPKTSDFDFHPRTLPLPGKRDLLERLSGLAINPVAKKAVVGYQRDRHGRNEVAYSRIFICNFERGGVLASVPVPGQMVPLALHDDGRRVLMRRDEGDFGKQDRLEIWSFQGKDVVPSLIWTPYADAVQGIDRDVTWAEFVDAKTLATASHGGKVALWDIAAAKPICYFQLDDGCKPTLSSDRKWIAFCSEKTVGIFDVGKREVIAAQETPRWLKWPLLAFSPSGRKIGCVTFDRILVWDTASGNLKKDFAVDGINLHGAIDYTDEDYILANNQYLIELDRHLKFWRYEHAEHLCTLGGKTCIACGGDRRGGALLAVKIPHPEAIAFLKKALNQSDLFIFHKGTPVRLDVSGIPAQQQNRVSEAIAKKLKEMKCPIDSSGKIDVVALIEGPKTREVSYSFSGTHQFQEYTTWLKFLYQGQTLWETLGTNVPSVVNLKSGENLESRLREKSQEPNYSFFDQVTLPEFLQKPTGDQRFGGGHTFGSSRVTPQGLR
jgi:hypothetical protein